MPNLGRLLARMMWWQGLAEYPVVAMLLAATAMLGLDLAESWGSQVGLVSPVFALGFWVAGLAGVVAALAIALCWLTALWYVFRAGQAAFGVWSGLVYASLGFLLSPWPGLCVIPHMVRLDVQRLLGVEPADMRVDRAEPS